MLLRIAISSLIFPQAKGLILLVGCLLLLLIAGCSGPPTADPSLSQTQIAMGVQMTVMAGKEQANLQATMQSLNATQIAADVQATVNAQAVQPPAAPPTEAPPPSPIAPPEASPTITPVALPAAPPTPPPADSNQTTSGEDFDTWKKSASILLYEDIIFHPDTTRYVKRTLDEMGLPYKDVGSAIGNFKSQLLTGGPQGQGWDLIIIASESKNAASGEFYQYVSEALDKGSSVIFELWFLDERMGPAGEALLSRCGVAFQRDWTDVPPNMMVMFPVNDTHPIMHEPNDGLTFTKVTDYWAYTYDIGDLLKISQIGEDASILVGTIGTESTNHGTLTVCVNDQLILQTFSTHQLTWDIMRRVWENYIHNALKTRYQKVTQ